MLKFNKEHHSLDGSINKQNKKSIKTSLLEGITSVKIFSGFAKNVQCNITGMHAHKYIKEDSFVKFIVSEREFIGEYYRTDEYININDAVGEIIDFENKNDLIRISINKSNIQNIIENRHNCIEYEYSVDDISMSVNGDSVSYTPMTSYYWTTDENHPDLTGKIREVYYMYYGYKLERKRNGKLGLVKSDLFLSLDELSEEYIYIKQKFYKKFDKITNKEIQIPDYEFKNKKNIKQSNKTR